MYEWSETDLMIRDAVRGFIAKEIRPQMDALESGEITPYPIIRKLFAEFGIDTMAADGVEKMLARERARETVGAAAGGAPRGDGGEGDDDEVWRSRAHDHLTVYTGLPNYRNSWTRQGFEESDYVRGGSDRLKRALVTRGLEATRARVQEHLDAGASTVLVQVLGENMLVPPVQDWRLAAEALLG